MVNKKFQKYATIGAGLGVTSWAVSMLYRLLPKGVTGIQSSLDFAPIAQGVKQSIQQGISTDLASNIIGLLNGVIAGGVMGFLTLVVAGIIVGVVGGYAVDFLSSIQAFKGLARGRVSNLVLIAVAGSLVSGFIVGLIGGNPALPAWQTTITMALYFTVIGFAYGILANLTAKTQLKQMFPDPR